MHKRGISNIVIVLLSILLVLAAIIIVWNVVKIMVKQQAEVSQVKAQLIGERMSISRVSINASNPSEVTVTIRKEKGKEELVSTETTTTTTTQNAEVDVFSVIDLSRSMGSVKLTAEKNASKQLVNNTIISGTNNRVGIVGYNNIVRPQNVLDLTNDKNALYNKIDSLATATHTCICCGIINATQRFLAQSPSAKQKIMIVMSDGDPSDSPYTCYTSVGVGDAIESARRANQTLSNLIIYSIGFEISQGSIAEKTMKNISRQGNGEYFYANVSTISAIYQTIVSEVINTINTYTTTKSINYMKIVFYNDTLSHVEIIEEPPVEVFKSEKFTFDLAGKISNINKIEIYPVIKTSSGKEVIGDVLDVWVK